MNSVRVRAVFQLSQLPLGQIFVRVLQVLTLKVILPFLLVSIVRVIHLRLPRLIEFLV